MSSDVFIISAARDAVAATAMREVLLQAGVVASRVEDAVFGLDGFPAMPDLDAITRAAGLSCPVAAVLPGLRALFFAAASMLSDDAELSLVVGLQQDGGTAFVMASPEAVGRLNLLPRARIAARSLAGGEAALRAVGLAEADVEICMDGVSAASGLYELLEELETKPARWGTLSSGEVVILVERV